MRVLLDECVPRQLRMDLLGHEVGTVAGKGWSGVKNGELLRRAQSEFDVLLTTDRGMEFQQNISPLEIALLVVAVGSNDVDVLRRYVPQILTTLDQIQIGEVRRVEARRPTSTAHSTTRP